MMIVKLNLGNKTLTKQGSIKIRFKTNYLIASFNALPDTNAGTLDAAILISAPACGLRPVRAARLFTLNVLVQLIVQVHLFGATEDRC